MTDPTTKLLAAASCASGAAMDIIETVRDGTIRQHDPVGDGLRLLESLRLLTDALRLLIEAMHDMPLNEEINEDADQLRRKAMRFLEARG